MTPFIVGLDDPVAEDSATAGGKAAALARLLRAGFAVPPGVVIRRAAYDAHLEGHGLRERIARELGRKRLDQMRWEELWDAALRIRGLFLRSHLVATLDDALRRPLAARFADRVVVVRSSAPDEDGRAASFAGLHETFVGVRGVEEILAKVRLVWASLWSDAALLYRRELDLSTDRSGMAVVVQELAEGRASGVAFSVDPDDAKRSIVEAVHGLNQGFVDGTVAPDRWLLERESGRILVHHPVERSTAVRLEAGGGVMLAPLAPTDVERAPLRDDEVGRVRNLAAAAEERFRAPQDLEWTLTGADLLALQSRPITTLREENGHYSRPWYLSLRRSLENLEQLGDRIETIHLPALAAAGERQNHPGLAGLDDAALADEIERRAGLVAGWKKIYWDDFIPFAHGIRLFGQVYNDALQPEDSHAFVDLLAETGMESVERNRMIERMATLLRVDEGRRVRFHRGKLGPDDAELVAMRDEWLQRFGGLARGGATPADDAVLLDALLEKAAALPPRVRPTTREDLEERIERYRASFPEDRRDFAERVLELGRRSWRLRDDDNLMVARIERVLEEAAAEGRRRLTVAERRWEGSISPEESVRCLRDSAALPQGRAEEKPATETAGRARQLVGQPAGPGIGRGTARLVLSPADLTRFEPGDILVCDAIDPSITIVVPLAGGVVERRGGMLIHGAIIAREYGIPCVTGVPEATRLIPDGAPVTVDGFLGIVTIGEAP